MKSLRSESELESRIRDAMIAERRTSSMMPKLDFETNKAGYTATQVASGWAGAIFEITRPFGQEQ